jgi:predicted TIM-barrel fold metal-dependent hydrolase
MLIDLHGHQPLYSLLNQHPHWGPFWDFDEQGYFHIRVGKWVLNLSTKEHKAAVESGTAKKVTDLREFMEDAFSVQSRITAMDSRGVDKLVISHSSHLYMYWAEPEFGIRYATHVNEQFSEYVAAAPDRLYFWGHLPMQDPVAAVAEVDRAKALGAVGFGIGGANFGGLELYSREFYPLWEKLCAEDMPLFVHGYNQSVSWGDKADTEHFDTTAIVGMCYDESQAFWHLVVSGVLDDFPNLKVYITHGGGYVPYQLGRFEGTNEVLGDARNKKPLREYLRNFWFDPLIHDLPMRQAIVDIIGADRLLYGDNFGGSDGIRDDLTDGLLLSDEDREKIRWKNAADLLNIPVPGYQRKPIDMSPLATNGSHAENLALTDA